MAGSVHHRKRVDLRPDHNLTVLQIETAPIFEPLLAPSRYKGAHGGRGSGKSHFFAEMMVEAAIMRPGFRGACIREVQRTLAQSVKKLIEDKIQAMGVGRAFEVQEAQIKTPGGGVIIFQGMQNHTADSVKSFEGFDVAYVEEAQSLSQRSLDLLRPTIRKENSELWFAWNPRFDTDAIDMFFRGGKHHAGAVCVEANWQDNPWFPDVLRAEMRDDYRNDPEKAAHVWGGGYETVTAGSYYGKELAKAEAEGRVGAFPYDDKLFVKTGWDIGVDDYTAIWYFQENWKDGMPRVRVIDYYETSGDGAQLIAQEAVHGKPYRFSGHHFPHDVMVREWGAGARTRFDTLTKLGVTPIFQGVQQGPEERINATRALLPICEFDSNPAVHLGLKRLRRYQRKLNETLGIYQGPLHDDNSHGADAFGEYAINCPLAKMAVQKKPSGFNDYKPRRISAGGDLGRV